MNLEEQKQRVIEAKRTADRLSGELSEKRKLIDGSIARLEQMFAETHSKLISVRESAVARAMYAEEELREAIVNSYDGSSKQLGDGMSVRINTSYNYQEKDAVGWALKHKMPALLKIDATKFKKLASVQEIDFVSKDEKVVAVVKF